MISLKQKGSYMKRKIQDFFANKDFYLQLLNATYLSLKQYNNPLRFNNFCLGYRELFTLFLKENIDDGQLMQSQWFSKDNPKYWDNTHQRITRNAYIRYNFFHNLSDTQISCFPNAFKEINDFVKLFNKLSTFVHIKQETFNINKGEIISRKKAFEECIFALITHYKNIEKLTGYDFFEQYEDELITYVANENIEDIDELSGSGYNVEEFYCEDVCLVKAVDDLIEISVRGTVSFETYHGYRDDECSFQYSLPFDARLLVSLDNGLNIKKTKQINVDSTSIYH